MVKFIFMSLGTKITGLSPFGPIFGKELRVASRRKRNHALRVLYLGGLLLFLLMYYTSTVFNRGIPSVAYRIQQQAEMGQFFFMIFAIFCACCMGLIAPVLTSTAVNSERLGKTLHVLLMTPITAWQIVCGKLFARLLIALMLIGLSLPVLAVVRLLGGVEVLQMVAVILLCTTFAMSCGALGVLFSSMINRSYAVILFAYASMFVAYFLVPMLIVVSVRAPTARIELFLMAINPVVNVGMLAEPGRALGRGTWVWQWLPGVLVQVGLTLVLLIAGAASLRRIARHAGESPVTPALPPEAEAAAEASTRGAKFQSVGDNAILWRELRRPLITKRGGPFAAVLVGVLLICTYLVFADAGALGDSELQMGYAWIFNGLYWLLIAVLSATAIAQEKESDTWTLLLVTPASGRAIVVGKFLGVARRMLWPTILIALHFMIFTISGILSATAFVLILWIIVTFNTVWLATGIYLSLRLKKVTSAVVCNLMIVAALFGVLPIVFAVIGNVFWRGPYASRLVEYAGWIMPYPFLGSVVDSFTPMRPFYEQRIWLPVIGYGTPVFEFVLIILFLGVLHLFVASLILLYTADRFDRIVGRAPQRGPQSQKIPPIPTLC